MVALKRRNILVVVAAILVVAIVLSSFVYINSQKSYSGGVESITIGMQNGEFNSLIYIANNQNYFINNGLNVTIKAYPSGAAAINGMLNGETDISIASEFVFANNILKNASISSVGSISSYLIQYLVARTDKGITTIADLKGKTIGVALGTNEQFFLGQFLQSNGVDLSQVNILNTPVVQAPNALANGTVDAVIAFQPNVNQIQSLLGNRTVMWPAQSNQPGYNLAMGTKSWVTTHPDLIIRFLKSLTEASSFTINHQEQAKSIITKDLNYSSSYLASVWQNYTFTVTLSQAQISAMQEEAQWLINNNLTNTTQIPNFLNYIYVNGLKTVSPDSVNIVG